MVSPEVSPALSPIAADTANAGGLRCCHQHHVHVEHASPRPVVVFSGLQRPVLLLQLERSVLSLEVDSVVHPPPRTRRSPQDRHLECRPEGRVGETASSKGSTIQHGRRSRCCRPPPKWQWLKLRVETVAPVLCRSPLETRPQSGAGDIGARGRRRTRKYSKLAWQLLWS